MLKHSANLPSLWPFTIGILLSITCSAQAKLKDIDGNNYNIVKIGKQYWQAQNLKVEKFKNGDAIRLAKNSTEWAEACVNKEPACCYYNFQSKYNKRYGKLYNWYAVNDKRGLAPKSWHIPTVKEINQLSNFLENDAGIKLKSKKNWYYDKSNQTMKLLSIENKGKDLYAFNAQAGGYVDSIGNFQLLKTFGYWWTADESTHNALKLNLNFNDDNSQSEEKQDKEYVNSDLKQDTENAVFFWLEYFSKFLDFSEEHKSCGYSVRCIKN
jgi:uncharacterized protein (TIGR02145 family)